jgi:hypothetical protein
LLKNFHVARQGGIPFNSRMAKEPRERFWKAAARKLARRVNLGWWLERWLSWVMSAGLLGAVAFLLARWRPVVDLRWIWSGVGMVLLAGGVAAYLAMRRRHESPAVARVRLEDALGLKARLSAAEAGVGAWPEPVETIDWPVRWRWQRPLAVLGLAALMLALAAFIPITPATKEGKHTIEKPSSVKDVEQWVEQLRKEKAVDEKSLEDLEKKIADLLQRPSENWYEHGSLEAADNLKEQTEGEMRQLADNLADAERAAAALQSMGESASPDVKKALGDGLATAARDMSAGGLKPNPELQKGLNDVTSAAGLDKMSPQQLKDLAKQLRDNNSALQKAMQDSKGLDTSKIPIAKNGKGKKGEAEGEGDGTDGDGKPGHGGANRGRGDAPMAFKEDATDLNSQKTEKLPSQIDVNRIAPGDTLALTDGKHEVDKNAYNGPKQGGAIQNTGDGGSAVWQNSLVPTEREALKKYFK